MRHRLVLWNDIGSALNLLLKQYSGTFDGLAVNAYWHFERFEEIFFSYKFDEAEPSARAIYMIVKYVRFVYAAKLFKGLHKLVLITTVGKTLYKEFSPLKILILGIYFDSFFEGLYIYLT